SKRQSLNNCKRTDLSLSAGVCLMTSYCARIGCAREAQKASICRDDREYVLIVENVISAVKRYSEGDTLAALPNDKGPRARVACRYRDDCWRASTRCFRK